MKNYRVILARGYIVSVNAKDKEKAASIAEFFIGSGVDQSTEADRAKWKFSIEEAEMALNEATEVEEIKMSEDTDSIT